MFTQPKDKLFIRSSILPSFNPSTYRQITSKRTPKFQNKRISSGQLQFTPYPRHTLRYTSIQTTTHTDLSTHTEYTQLPLSQHNKNRNKKQRRKYKRKDPEIPNLTPWFSLETSPYIPFPLVPSSYIRRTQSQDSKSAIDRESKKGA